MSFISDRPHLIPCLIAATMCFVAIGDHPYAYYTLVRVVTFVAALVGGLVAYRADRIWALWMFGVVALLFNPIVPVHLTKEVWCYLDALAGAALILGGLVVRIADGTGLASEKGPKPRHHADEER